MKAYISSYFKKILVLELIYCFLSMSLLAISFEDAFSHTKLGKTCIMPIPSLYVYKTIFGNVFSSFLIDHLV